MKPPLRLAILECDDGLAAKFGTYGAMFTSLLSRGAEQLFEDRGADEGWREPPQIQFSTFDVVNDDIYPALEEVDGVLISGSKWDSFGNEAWILQLLEFTKEVLAQRRVKLIGVCFGHQIIGRALGVKVGRSDLGWELAVQDVKLTPKGKEVLGLDALKIHQMHRDIVYFHPKEVEPLGATPLCEVQGMYAKDRLISVQGHPEFTAAIETDILIRRHDAGVITDAMYEDAMDRVRNQHDGLLVAAAFVKFLLEG